MATLNDGDCIRLLKTITVNDNWEDKKATLLAGAVGFVIDGPSYQVEFSHRELAKKHDPAMYGKNNPAYFNDFDEFYIDSFDSSITCTIHDGQFEKLTHNPDNGENA